MSDVTDETSVKPESATGSTIEQPEAKNALVIPGQRLREAREAQGVTLADVAGELRLEISVIKALETGDTEKLPLPVFTAGYLRSYARFIGLSPDELVAQFNGPKIREKPPSRSESMGGLSDQYRKITAALPRHFSFPVLSLPDHSNLRVQMALLTGIVLVILISWQSARWFSGPETSPEMVQAVPPTTESVASAGMSQADSLMPETTALAMSKKSDTAAVAKENDATTLARVQTAPAVITEAELQHKKDTEVEVAVISQPLALKPLPGSELGSVDTPAAEDNMAEQPKEVVTTELLLQFTENSWVDIRDATGKRLMRDLGATGDTKRLSGVAPFQVVFGFGPGVKIEYNGTPYDFSPYQGKKIARFTLEVPEDEDIQASEDEDEDDDDAGMQMLEFDPDTLDAT